MFTLCQRASALFCGTIPITQPSAGTTHEAIGMVVIGSLLLPRGSLSAIRCVPFLVPKVAPVQCCVCSLMSCVRMFLVPRCIVHRPGPGSLPGRIFIVLSAPLPCLWRLQRPTVPILSLQSLLLVFCNCAPSMPSCTRFSCTGYVCIASFMVYFAASFVFFAKVPSRRTSAGRARPLVVPIMSLAGPTTVTGRALHSIPTPPGWL